MGENYERSWMQITRKKLFIAEKV